LTSREIGLNICTSQINRHCIANYTVLVLFTDIPRNRDILYCDAVDVVSIRLVRVHREFSLDPRVFLVVGRQTPTSTTIDIYW
jgi:hypothetical protein